MGLDITTFELPRFILVRNYQGWNGSHEDHEYSDSFTVRVYSTAKDVEDALNLNQGEEPDNVVGLWRLDGLNKSGLTNETITHVAHLPNGEEKHWVEHDWKVSTDKLSDNVIYQDDLVNHLAKVLMETRKRRLTGDA